MDYVIYTVGNAEFLAAIFNGVAAITTSKNFTSLISIGMLFGCLYVCWESIYNGTRTLNIQHMLVAVCVYLCMFGPTRTVIIQDVYNTGAADRVVDNIPLGVAASGSIVSRIGYGICVLIETGFHPASTSATVYQGGFAEPLRILNAFRTFKFGDKVYAQINESLGSYVPHGESKEVKSNIEGAIRNYIRDCTYPEIAMGHKSANIIRIMKQEEGPLKSTNGALHTYLPINVDSGLTDPQTFSCANGYVALQKAIQNSIKSAGVQGAISEAIGGSLTKSGDGSSTSALTNIDNSLDSLGLLGIDAQQLVIDRITNRALGLAAAGHYKTMQDTATAIAVTSAIEQRNIQWASEGTMFTKAMHALMTFIEGFCYAIMPIMAFVFVMGAMGMRIVGKYFQIVLWIQLWYPIMAIVNLYVIKSTKTALAPYASSNSFYDVNAMFHEVETHIGVAGLMLGATPLLALLIISGSSMAFTAIAGRMGGQDHFNEKAVQPDALNIAPVSQVNPYAQTVAGRGTTLGGAEELIPSVNIGAAAQNLRSSSSSALNSTTSAATEAFTQATGTTLTKDQSAAIQRTVAGHVQGSEAYQAARSSGLDKAFQEAYGTNDAISHNMAGNYSNFLTTGLVVKGNGGGLKWQWTDTTGQTHQEDLKTSHIGRQMAGFLENHSASLNKAVSEGYGLASNLSFDGKSLSSLDSKLAKAFSDTASASKQYSRVTNATKDIGVDQRARMDQHAQQLLNKAKLGDSKVSTQLHNLFSNVIPGDDALSKHVAENSGNYGGWTSTGRDNRKSQLAAALHYMLTEGTDRQKTQAFNLIQAAEGHPGSMDFDANRNAGIERPDVPQDLRQRADGVQTEAQKIPDVAPEVKAGLNNISSLVEPRTKEAKELTGKTPSEVYNTGKNEARGEFNRERSAMQEKEFLEAEKQLLDSNAGSRLSNTQLVGAKLNQLVKDPKNVQRVFDAAKLTNAQQRVAYARAYNRQPEQADLDAVRTETAQMYDARYGKAKSEEVAAREERVKKASDAIIGNLLHGSVENAATYARITAFNEKMLGQKLCEFQTSEFRGSASYTPNSLETVLTKKMFTQEHLDRIERSRRSLMNEEGAILGVVPKSIGESEEAKKIPK